MSGLKKKFSKWLMDIPIMHLLFWQNWMLHTSFFFFFKSEDAALPPLFWEGQEQVVLVLDSRETLHQLTKTLSQLYVMCRNTASALPLGQVSNDHFKKIFSSSVFFFFVLSFSALSLYVEKDHNIEPLFGSTVQHSVWPRGQQSGSF